MATSAHCWPDIWHLPNGKLEPYVRTIHAWLINETSTLYYKHIMHIRFYSYGVLWFVQIVECIMARMSYSFVCTSHFLIMIKMQKVLNLQKLVSNMLSSVSKIKSIISISGMLYIGMHVFRWPISLLMITRICVLCLIITIKSETFFVI